MRWGAAVDRAVAPLGLTHAQYTLLASLRGFTSGGARPSQRRLADHIGLEPIFVSKLVKTLVASGLVERTPDPDDTRAVRLGLTAAGTDVVDRAITVVRELQRVQTAALGGANNPRRREFDAALVALLGDDA
jgi:MarR family transcriptional regulator, organic hydroperoxide resistance regulator